MITRFLTAIFILIFSSSITVSAKVEKITYRKWIECYRISNDSITVIINASAGGRIMVYERNNINVIYENPTQDGLLLVDYMKEGFDPDGARFDYGQERITSGIHATTFLGPYTGTILSDFSLKITSIADLELGILTTRVFTLDPYSSRLNIIQTMKNISEKPVRYFFWGRTLVKIGGKLFMPLNPCSLYPDKWGRYIWGDVDKFESDSTDQGVEIKGCIFSLIPGDAKNDKYGNDSQAGWMAYGYKSLLFIKKYDFNPEASYTEDFGQTNIFYCKKYAFAEMEPLSPTAELRPGDEYSFKEDWYLFNYRECNEVSFDVNAASEFIQNRINNGK